MISELFIHVLLSAEHIYLLGDLQQNFRDKEIGNN
jgi:hypothetical protein